jgi:hypothetical protein
MTYRTDRRNGIRRVITLEKPSHGTTVPRAVNIDDFGCGIIQVASGCRSKR